MNAAEKLPDQKGTDLLKSQLSLFKALSDGNRLRVLLALRTASSASAS